jgi:hypothetical protein
MSRIAAFSLTLLLVAGCGGRDWADAPLNENWIKVSYLGASERNVQFAPGEASEFRQALANLLSAEGETLGSREGLKDEALLVVQLLEAKDSKPPLLRIEFHPYGERTELRVSDEDGDELLNFVVTKETVDPFFAELKQARNK